MSPTDQPSGLTTGTQLKYKPFQKENQKQTSKKVLHARFLRQIRKTVCCDKKPRALHVVLGGRKLLGSKYLFTCLDSSEPGEERRDERSAWDISAQLNILFCNGYRPQLMFENTPYFFLNRWEQLLDLLLSSGQPHHAHLQASMPNLAALATKWQASNATLTWCLAVSIPSRTVVLKSSCLPCGRKEENSGTLLHKLNHTGHKGPAVGVLGIKFHQLTKPVFWEWHLLEPRFRAQILSSSKVLSVWLERFTPDFTGNKEVQNM